jgi:protease YdgD
VTPGRWIVAAAAVVAALLAAAPLRADATADPIAAVGRVLRDGGGPCSGVLVAPRRVLTVGHCVARGRPWRAWEAARLSVVLGGRSYAVVAAHLPARGPFAEDGRLDDVARDWAYLELAEAPAPSPLPLGAAAAARRAFILDAAITKVGWAGGRQRRDDGCRITGLERDGTVIAFRCGGDAGAGRSGSALLLAEGERVEVIGTQSAEGRDALGVVGFAVAPPAP